MTVLTTIQSAAAEALGMDVPTLLFGNTDREWVEMQSVVNTAARMIRDAYDWQALRKIHAFSGDSSAEAFALPSDYERMLPTSSLWSSRWFWSINRVADADQWLELQVVPISAVYGNWMLYGSEIHILPVMEATETVKFFYVSKNVVLDNTSTQKETFTSDSDTFRLSEHLLKLAVIYMWKMRKGLPYAEENEDYQNELGADMNKDQGSKPVLSAQPWASWRNKNIAWPGTVTGAS